MKKKEVVRNEKNPFSKYIITGFLLDNQNSLSKGLFWLCTPLASGGIWSSGKLQRRHLLITLILTLIMVQVTMDIMVIGYGSQVTGVLDGLTIVGGESGIRDIGGIIVKGNVSLFTIGTTVKEWVAQE